jgi:hypothetical protein
MADNSAIEWTEATWNPVTGCSKVSPGCAHCYAETFAERWQWGGTRPKSGGRMPSFSESSLSILKGIQLFWAADQEQPGSKAHGYMRRIPTLGNSETTSVYPVHPARLAVALKGFRGSKTLGVTSRMCGGTKSIRTRVLPFCRKPTR